ncbi:MAG: D-alanyl-D-alanine carboxypeptidase [Clostridiales bacterium]|nr:D-alanyl-D-alanine carboxypeptidase [Clostridiales bacterium]
MNDEPSFLDEAYEKSMQAYQRGISLKKIWITCFLVMMAIVLVTLFVFFGGTQTTKTSIDPLPNDPTPPPVSARVDMEKYSFEIEEDIHSRAAILVNYTTGHVVCERNSSAELFPASLTKMMTVLVAIENIKDINAQIFITGNSFGRLAEENASVAGLTAGSTVSFMDLCYATILASGADAALTLAEYISGSEEAFVTLMNGKAKELGMDGTNYCNVTGLHDDNHYTTAYDMAMLLQYALKNENFYRVFTSDEYQITSDGAVAVNLTVQSTVFEKARHMVVNKLNTGTLLGGKSGYTTEAGLCLASLCKVGDQEYITVTLSADGTLYTPQYSMIDTYRLINEYAY